MREEIIAIDGPAGAGKSTVARLVAQKLNYLYIDTGAMYRALTLKALREGVDFEDEESLIKLASQTKIEFKKDKDHSIRVFLDGKDVSSQIRGEDINLHISQLSRIKGVRMHMVSQQRKLAKGKRVVLEGRDIGTVVFPEARYKFYLDADFSERLRRRFRELLEKGERISLDAVRRDLIRRDRSDKLRKTAPLKKAKDAIYIDSTHLSIDEVVELMLSYIK